MLRNFYILICIPLCFCYEYIENNQQFRNRKENSEIENVKHEKRKVFQFDVASFLRSTSAEKLQDYEPYVDKNKDRTVRTQSDYYYESPLNENIKKRNDYNYFNIDSDLDSNDNDPRPKDGDKHHLNSQSIGKIAINEDSLVSSRENKVKNKQNELLYDNDLIINPEKKCAFKDMKVPFFSHKTTAKKQKRKFLCFKCSKSYAKEPLKSEALKTKPLSSKLKRAYGNVCPKCLKNLLKLYKKEPQNNNIVHNSRQFYQKVATKDENENRLHKEKYHTSSTRLKRDDHDEQLRRLKELADVERKIDHVKITTPKFNLVPTKIENDISDDNDDEA